VITVIFLIQELNDVEFLQ